ncbi:MAG TPA: glycosyltransferase family 4 protein, partial [Gemmatimonadales bacterium]
LFIGNFIHPPNLDAAERLVHRIVPLILRELPLAELRIVGPDPGPALLASRSERVTVTGWVPDTGEHLEDAAVVVAPLRLGGGMRVKVGEALAAGKAVVATPLAAEGLEVEDGNQLLLAESDESFASAVVALLRDPERRAALAGRARAWARDALTWDRPVAAFEALYQSLGRDSPRG